MRFRVQGHSMEPTFSEGATVLATSIPYFFYEPKVKDVVIVEDPRDNKILLKRITKKEGDRFFVAGDNKHASTDSHSFGPVLKGYILGKVIANF